MSKKTSFLSVAVSILLVSPLFAAQVSSNWVGGSSGQWETASNWNPPLVPDNNATQTYAVTISGNVKVGLETTYVIDQLDCYGNIVIEAYYWWGGAGVECLNGLTNHGYLSIRIGTKMYIHGNLNNLEGCTIVADRSVEVYAGDIKNDGLTIISPMSSLSIDDQVDNTGQIDVYGGNISAYEVNNGTLHSSVNGFGTLVAHTVLRNNGGKIYAFGGALLLFAPAITNTGTLRNNPGSTVAAGISPSNHNNQGLIEINSDGAITFDSNLINEPNGVIRMLGGTLGAVKITQKPDANFTGFGGITGNVQIDPNAIVKLTGPTNVVGDVNVPAGATLEISDGQTLITGHTACKGTIHLKGGTAVFQGGCDCNDCNIINEAGLDRNHFDLNADGKVDLEDFDYFAKSWLWEASWY